MKMFSRAPAILVTLSVFALTFPVAAAQDRLSRTELTAISNELGLSVEELQTRSEQLQVQNADIALQMRELEAENAQLNGRIETLQFQLGQSRDEVTRMQNDDQEIGRVLEELENKIADLESRLARREQAFSLSTPQQIDSAGQLVPGSEQGTGTESRVGGPAAGVAPSISAAANLPSGPEPLFQDGKARLLRFDYEGAERSFRAYLQQYENLPQAGEAQYWLGEVLYQQKSYSESGAAYSDMIRKFPTDSRAPDALVKLGRSLRLVGDQERACAILATLPTRYPDASPVTRNLADVERSRSACKT